MDIRCVWEHNGADTLLYAQDYIGAFTRGESLEAAMRKMPNEIRSYLSWLGREIPETLVPIVVQEKRSNLCIRDADSDVLFDSERIPLTQTEYEHLKSLSLASAKCFYSLYASIENKNITTIPARDTFYGAVPRTAEEMYQHTKNVNAYYFGEIGVSANNNGTIYACRRNGFNCLERQPGFLSKPPCEGSYAEMWSVRKIFRRFIWHDRIHAKAMWRMAQKTLGINAIPNIFRF